MGFIVEDGTGRVDANAYTDAAFVLEYLTNRNRQTENTWDTLPTAEQEAHIIAATDFIETKYFTKFLGVQQFTNLGNVPASDVLTLSVQPTAADTVTINGQPYTFVAVLAVAFDVLIGADIRATADNLADAINLEPGGAGVSYGVGTTKNADVSALSSDDQQVPPVLAFVTVTALVSGRVGNGLAVSASNALSATWKTPTTQGGSDAGDVQALSFPRLALVTRNGQVVSGVPVDLQKATAEYSVRAAAATLQPDPVQDPVGSVSRVKEVAGPVESDITYESGSTNGTALRNYPAADNYLKQYLGAGSVIR